MTLDYSKVWNTMNDLEMVTCKIASAREILDSAMDRLQEHQYDKTETLLYAADEYLQYYLAEFDKKFKEAWKETVIQLKKEEIETLHYTDDEIDSMCAAAEEEELISKGYFKEDDSNKKQKDKVVKWILPIEEVDCDECIINFPDDLLEAANLKEGDEVEWVDRGDGSFLIRKIEKASTQDEMIAKGYTMTDDGFWIKESLRMEDC
jgi:hypothetical protein